MCLRIYIHLYSLAICICVCLYSFPLADAQLYYPRQSRRWANNKSAANNLKGTAEPKRRKKKPVIRASITCIVLYTARCVSNRLPALYSWCVTLLLDGRQPLGPETRRLIVHRTSLARCSYRRRTRLSLINCWSLDFASVLYIQTVNSCVV
jgi:hypothetical protein